MATGNQQKSSDSAYINSQRFLENARTSLTNLQARIDDERMHLSNGYQGADGSAMQQKFWQWLDAVEAVKGTCRQMEETLEGNRQNANRGQERNMEALQHVPNVGSDFSTSQHTFQSLTTPS